MLWKFYTFGFVSTFPNPTHVYDKFPEIYFKTALILQSSSIYFKVFFRVCTTFLLVTWEDANVLSVWAKKFVPIQGIRIHKVLCVRINIWYVHGFFSLVCYRYRPFFNPNFALQRIFFCLLFQFLPSIYLNSCKEWMFRFSTTAYLYSNH